MKKHHEVQDIKADGDTLWMLVDGKKHSFPISSISKRLAKETQVERESFRVSPSGYGIHWTLIDEDLSIDGLLGINHQPQRFNEKAST